MNPLFPRWHNQLEQAHTAEAQRALLLEVAQWRMAHLIDVVGQRDSAWAASQLLARLGDAASAEREARALHSLCSTPPSASMAEIEAAESWLGTLTGQTKPQQTAASKAARRELQPPPKPRERAPKQAAPVGARMDGAIAAALAHGRAGEYKEAFAALKGVPGDRAWQARTWLDVHRALHESDPAQREQRLQSLLGRLEKGLPGGATPAAKRATSPATTEARTAPSAPATPSAPQPNPRAEARAAREQRNAALIGALTAETAPSVETLVPLVRPFDRLRDVFDMLSKLDPAASGEAVLAAVAALHEVVEPHVRLSQATSLVLRLAIGGTVSEAAKALLTAGPVSERIGGPGMDRVIAIAQALHHNEVAVDRVLRGLTRRERRDSQALELLSPHLEGMWRLLVTSGAHRGEIWFLEDLSVEGRAAVPLMVLEERPRLAVIASTGTLLQDWPGLGGPPAVEASEDAVPTVVDVVKAWGAMG